VLARKRARDRSLAEPVFGLSEHREGALVSLSKPGERSSSLVVVMEVRRKSGRGVREVFVFSPTTNITLLDDHPAYALPETGKPEQEVGEEEVQTTFNLGLTEKQRRDREAVVLPYFDAQKDGGGMGPGEGGRILYEMGVEDREDFDDEEDEI
jgi:elongator complex protein 5